ncbi:acyltransferase [Actinotalea sp. M2MS4P-6]|uniref:acyltransferase family protein n=1 Tax=Actinotalea sp. M2MS4P-6 TaxID=2983762 RepID=UPI0021E450CB|nr:acyltransferase [Actinotalea sp. M2MS4P-6]MCV2394179.1 acyltransferase [Actinotalea sp. M2MS4P-6]
MTAVTSPATTDTKRRLELPHLDGLRGLAALTVVLYHAFLFTGNKGDGYADLPVIGRVLGWGYLGVPLFIVLSGYVLMLPVVRQEGYRLSRGFRGYIGRRAKRILPPYYAALGLSLALIAAVPVMQQPSGTQWDSKVPVTDGAVVSHLFLLHDLRNDWIGKINGPLWSIAVEWQIYFLMPLVLLPLWRRIHPALVAALAVLATTLPSALGNHRYDYAHPWLIGLFALGMLAAQASVDRRWSLRWLPAVLWVSGIVLAVVFLVWWDWWHRRAWASETAFGLLAAGVLVLLGRRAVAGEQTRTLRFLNWRPVALLGLISYSVYLLHSPLLGGLNLVTLGWGLPTWAQYTFLTVVGVPAALALCAGFYWLVERRFKNSHQQIATAHPSAPAAADESSPAAAEDQPSAADR